MTTKLKKPRLSKELRNIGPKSAEWLAAVGVSSRAELEQMGSVEAFLRVRDEGFGASLTFLYALEAGLMDLSWKELPHGVRAELRQAVRMSEYH